MKKNEITGLFFGLISLMVWADQPEYIQGEKIPREAGKGAYNQSANYTFQNSSDLYFTADFIYWCLEQENVKLGKKVTPGSSGALGLFTGASQTVYLDPTYKPGFQLGMGFDMAGMDDWNLYSQYTWYQNNHTTKASGEVVLGVFGSDVVIAEKASLTSHYRLNNLQISLQRPFYSGRKLTMNFGWGLRALWVWQKMTLNASDLESLPVSSFTQLSMDEPLKIVSSQKSWALGPRIGVESNWLLGKGFRAIADAAGSILYTRYTQLDRQIDGSAIYGIISNLRENTSNNLSVLRAITEAFLGIGWGSYLGVNRSYHLDLVVGYDFNIYWNQNMCQVISHNVNAENTYLHGLNCSIRFDF